MKKETCRLRIVAVLFTNGELYTCDIFVGKNAVEYSHLTDDSNDNNNDNDNDNDNVDDIVQWQHQLQCGLSV